jgi:hypothetical protein
MRSAGHQTIAAAGVVLSPPTGTAPRDASSSPTAMAAGPETHVLLTPAGTFINGSIIAPDHRTDRQRHLAVVIRQRIESRLMGRVRDLSVRFVGSTVVLEGRCATYYTKQLAQHAALAVLDDDEHLENEIVVSVPR